MVSNRELAKRFAQGATKGTGSHMFIEGDTIYSYGHHFPIARRHPQAGFLFNSGGYSPSTGRHKSYVSQEIGSNYIEVPGANIENANKQYEYNQKKIAEYQAKQQRARTARSRVGYQHGIWDLMKHNQRLSAYTGW